MRIAVLGATGKTGHHLIRQAMARGHHVVAVVRDPKKLDVPRHDHMRVDQTDGLTEDSLRASFAGCDAVLSCLGDLDWPWKTITFFSDTIRIVTDGMRAADVTRLVCVTASAVRESPDDTWPIKFFVRPIMGRHFADMERMEDFLKQECPDLNYTVVKPPKLTDKDLDAREVMQDTGEIVHDQSLTLPRPNLAAFMLDCLDSNQHSRAMVAVALPK